MVKLKYSILSFIALSCYILVLAIFQHEQVLFNFIMALASSTIMFFALEEYLRIKYEFKKKKEAGK